MNEALALLKTIVTIFSNFSTIVTAVTILVKPFRERVFGFLAVKSGMKCLLRSDMLRVYHKGRKHRQLRQYEIENFKSEYAAYKALGGNSFMDDVHQEVRTWEMIS